MFNDNKKLSKDLKIFAKKLKNIYFCMNNGVSGHFCLEILSPNARFAEKEIEL